MSNNLGKKFIDNYPCQQLTRKANKAKTNPYLLSDFNLLRQQSAPLDPCVHEFIYIYMHYLHIQALILYLMLPYSHFWACQLTVLSSKTLPILEFTEGYAGHISYESEWILHFQKVCTNESQELQNRLCRLPEINYLLKWFTGCKGASYELLYILTMTKLEFLKHVLEPAIPKTVLLCV